MDNSNLDDTLPTPTNPPPEDDDADLASTRPSPGSPASEPGVLWMEALGRRASEPPESPMPGPDEPGDMDATMPVLPGQGGAEPPGPGSKKPKKPRKRRMWPLFILLGLLLLGVVASASAMGGYREGISLRQNAASTQDAASVQEQYELGVQDMEAGQYYRARQRFEYVIRHNPQFPGVTEKLADVLLELNTTATPTVAPTPTLTPTPDLRGVEELYTQGQQALADGNWTSSIETLLTLRKADPDYHMLEIDGMLFLALRNRGRDKIIKEADLEGGIYDLALAERFGPLDTEAQGILVWARLYITGASFWEIDWEQAVFYLAQVAPQVPNLRDGSGWTAMERYRIALIGYGDTLMGREAWCDAATQYELALSIGADTKAEEALAEAYKNCAGESDESDSGEPGSTPADTPSPEEPGDTEPVQPPTTEEPVDPEPTETPTPEGAGEAEPTEEPSSSSPAG